MIDTKEVAEKAKQTLLVQLTEADLIAIIRREVVASITEVANLQHSPIPVSEPELLTRSQVRTLFGVSMPTLIRWAKEKTLPCLHFNRSVRYLASDVNKLLRHKKGKIL